MSRVWRIRWKASRPTWSFGPSAWRGWDAPKPSLSGGRLIRAGGTPRSQPRRPQPAGTKTSLSSRRPESGWTAGLCSLTALAIGSRTPSWRS
eukprot:scaffold318604_cov27-Prasinocladus_malaysianus.AAC.1